MNGLAGDNINPGAKAGVIFLAEEGLVDPLAAWAGTFVTPGAGAAGQWRPDLGAAAATSGAGIDVVPGWVKASRVGAEVHFAYSPDGVVWIPFGQATINGFGPNVLVGLAVSARDDATGLPLVTGTFANVKVTRFEAGAVLPDAGTPGSGGGGDGGITGGDGPLPSGALPAGWSIDNLGTPLPGAATFRGGRFNLAGGGRDIWARSDHGIFVHRRINGDAEITGRLLGVQPTNQHAKVGLMIRASLEADDVNTMWLAKPNDPPNGGIVQGLSFQWRPARAENSTARNQRFIFPPQTLRLARKGPNVEASVLIAQDKWFVVWRQALDLPEAIYVGLAVTSHDQNLIATGLVENVTVVGQPAPPCPTPAPATPPPTPAPTPRWLPDPTAPPHPFRSPRWERKNRAVLVVGDVLSACSGKRRIQRDFCQRATSAVRAGVPGEGAAGGHRLAFGVGEVGEGQGNLLGGQGQGGCGVVDEAGHRPSWLLADGLGVEGRGATTRSRLASPGR